MLTHDPKLDDPALMIALASPAFYVGALGSKSTHEKEAGKVVGSRHPTMAAREAAHGQSDWTSAPSCPRRSPWRLWGRLSKPVADQG